MKGRISNKMGEIQINPDVIALYAGTIAVECFGIVGMAAVSMKDGFSCDRILWGQHISSI